jgi:hypothetical protein
MSKLPMEARLGAGFAHMPELERISVIARDPVENPAA